MFFAAVLREDGSSTLYGNAEDLAQRGVRETDRVWLEVERPDELVLSAIGSEFSLDREALDDCVHGVQRPRIDEFEGHILLVFYGMVGAATEAEVAPRKLAAFLGDKFLITVHRDPLRTVDVVRERCSRHPSNVLGGGVDYVLYRIIDGMVDRYLDVAAKYEARLETLEEDSLDPADDGDVVFRSRELRRELLEVRRFAIAQRELLVPLVEGDFDFVSGTLGQRFAHVRDHLTEVIDFVDAMRDRLKGVHENFHLLLAQRTNDTMRTLTIFASIMLPLGLIAGIYGMNVPVWPGDDSPYNFWIILAAMAGLGGGLLVYFRRKGWL